MVYFSTQITGKYYVCAVKINLGITPIAVPKYNSNYHKNSRFNKKLL